MRTVEGCAYRSKALREGTEERARCGLIPKIIGSFLEEADINDRVTRDWCQYCITKHLPSEEQPNAVVASLVYRAVGTVPGVSSNPKAKQLLDWVGKFLDSVAPVLEEEAALSRGLCFHLGKLVETQSCLTCRGNVKIKIYECLHPRHEKTRISECRHCLHHEEKLIKGSVRDWAVGVTTAARPQATLETTLSSLGTAGWTDPFIFADDQVCANSVPEARLATRVERLGAWPNWLLSLHELTLRYPHADAFMICQDDVVFCKGLRRYLEATLWPAERLGVVSLHTASHQDRGDIEGFYPACHGWGAWGAQAYVFPNASARALLACEEVVNHRSRGPNDGMWNIDSVVGKWCYDARLPYYLHTPSLAQHIGNSSTLWSNGEAIGRRRAATFIGEEQDISNFMNLRLGLYEQ